MSKSKINLVISCFNAVVLLVVLTLLIGFKIPQESNDEEIIKPVDIEVLNASVSTKKETMTSATPKREPTEAEAAYISRFAKVAQAEQEKYGIPASIKIGQGLLESNRGKSELATKANNHFGIKCFSKKCKKGHCMNKKDDSHKDFFRVYRTAWESYRAHSIFLQKKRYKHLIGKQYKDFAYGLKKAGYATSKTYADDLIRLIEQLNLTRYDK